MSEDGLEVPRTPTRNRNSHSSSTKAPPPLHLSEFYSFVNGNNNNHNNNNSNNNHNNHNNNILTDSPISTTISVSTNMSTGGKVINPSFISTSSNLSNFSSSRYFDDEEDDDNESVIITLKDVLKIINKYEQVIKKAQLYSGALQEMSRLSSEFGESIEELAKLKGCDEVGDDFIKSSGLQYVNSNYELILSNLIRKNLIEPLKVKLDVFKQYQFENDYQFQRLLKLKLQNLHVKEVDLKNFNRMKKKNLNFNLSSYKHNLISITNELSSIENFKKLNYQHLLCHIEQFQKDILKDLSSIVRLQLEINETILKKSWSGGGLDELISRCPDPFIEIEPEIDILNNNYNQEEEEGEEENTLNNDIELIQHNYEHEEQEEEEQEQEQPQLSMDEDFLRENSFSLPIIPSNE